MTPAEFRALRLAFGLTQAEMATALGLSSDTVISRYERATMAPSNTVERMLRLMADVPAARRWLLGG